jgi:hypothetical protein
VMLIEKAEKLHWLTIVAKTAKHPIIKTSKGEWLGSLQFQDILLVIYFEKEEDVGFLKPEEALATVHAFTIRAENVQKIYVIQAEKIVR